MGSSQLYSMGSNADGQLGIGNVPVILLPTRVPFLTGMQIREVSGPLLRHSLVLHQNGTAYSFGQNIVRLIVTKQ
jgi:alpha-tubulin suppressor-like RCC1 family protein